MLNKNVVTWEDIPYAIPPEGDLRWKAPRALISPESNIQPQDGNGCLQEASIYAGIQGEGIVGQEDCLYLDIKAPVNNLNRRLPVMFWIHGGGNTSGVKDYYDFSELIREHEVLVVTINYRLGPMGWFTHPAIQGLQNGIDKTSNFGTLDIMEALKWVRANIQNFGGDQITSQFLESQLEEIMSCLCLLLLWEMGSFTRQSLNQAIQLVLQRKRQ